MANPSEGPSTSSTSASTYSPLNLRAGILAEIGKLGEEYDILVAAGGSRAWLARCRFRPLGEYAMCCAVPAGHRLARRGILYARKPPARVTAFLTRLEQRLPGLAAYSAPPTTKAAG